MVFVPHIHFLVLRWLFVNRVFDTLTINKSIEYVIVGMHKSHDNELINIILMIFMPTITYSICKCASFE